MHREEAFITEMLFGKERESVIITLHMLDPLIKARNFRKFRDFYAKDSAE